MPVCSLISFLFLLISSIRADLLTDCSGTSDSYYRDGTCYVIEQYDKQNSLRSSCTSVNAHGKLIDVHTADVLANISRTQYNPKKGHNYIQKVYFNGYKLKVGDEIRIVGRYLPGLANGAIYYQIADGNIPLILQMDLVPHQVSCWAVDVFDTSTNDPAHIRNEVNNDTFDITLKITPNSYEFYFDNVLVHTCGQNRSYHDISEITGWAYPNGVEWVTDLVTINGQIYGGQKYFWSGITNQGGKWVWENSGLEVSSNYDGWTNGHPTEEANKKCALIDGTTGRLITANCNQRATGICQYIEQPEKYRFSLDVKDKKVSASSFLAEFTTEYYAGCLLKCGQVNTCKSVSYNKETGHCQFHDIYSGLDVISATGYDIYNKV